MGRPRQYANAAERQRAYRERLEAEMVRVNRESLERLEARLEHREPVMPWRKRVPREASAACSPRCRATLKRG